MNTMRRTSKASFTSAPWSSSCAIYETASSTYRQNVERAQKRLDTVIQEIEKNVSPETIITCGREVIAGVPAEKYSKRTYWAPKSELAPCWSSLGLDRMLVKVGVNGTGQRGSCLTVILKVEEEEIVLFVYSEGVRPDALLVESPYSRKWREGLYVLYPVRM
jgi:hypothetical protein